MKLKKLIVCILLVVMLLSLVSCGLDKTLDSHFDTWAPEKNEKIQNVCANEFVYLESGEIELDDYVADKIFLEVFLEQDGVLYFCYAERIANDYPRKIWNIASFNIATEEVQILYSDELSSVERKEGYNYSKLAYSSDRENKYGGLYENGIIYLKGSEKIIAYDIAGKSVQEIEAIPQSKYSWSIDDQRQAIEIQDNEQGISRTITLSEMANMNDYAKELLELSKDQIWNESLCSQKLFAMVKVSEDNIYIVCEWLNYWGEAYAIVFCYDFDLNEYYYLDYYFMNDSVTAYYTFIS